MANKGSNKKLGLIFGVLIVIALLMVLFDTKEERSFKGKLVDVDTSSVTAISLYPKANGHKEVYLFKKDNNWKVRINNNRTDDVPASKIKNLFNELLSLKAQRLASKDEGKWNYYEVDSTGTRVVLKEGTEPIYDLIIGKFKVKQPRSAATYVRIAGNDETYEVNGFLSLTFNRHLNSFRDGKIIGGNPQEWTKLTFDYPADSSFQLVKVNDKWQSSTGTQIDSLKTANFLRKLSNLSSEAFLDSLNSSNLPPQTHALTIESANKGAIVVEGYTDQDNFIIHSTTNNDDYFDGKKNNISQDLFIGLNRLFPDKK